MEEPESTRAEPTKPVRLQAGCEVSASSESGRGRASEEAYDPSAREGQDMLQRSSTLSCHGLLANTGALSDHPIPTILIQESQGVTGGRRAQTMPVLASREKGVKRTVPLQEGREEICRE